MKNVGRKCYHVLGGLLLLGIYHLLKPVQALIVYLLLFLGILAFDLARLRSPAFNGWAIGRMGTLLRPDEARTISGSPTYVAGVALTLFLFDLPVATTAVLFLVFGDVAATIVGEARGRTKILGKSLEGTAAFVIAGTAAGIAARLLGQGVSFPALAAGALTAAAVEVLTPKRLNDNLTIPLLSGMVMTLVGRV